MDHRLSKPKQIQVKNGKTFNNSNANMQDEVQTSFYRTKDSPMRQTSQTFEQNHVSYSTLKKIKNTIDL